MENHPLTRSLGAESVQHHSHPSTFTQLLRVWAE